MQVSIPNKCLSLSPKVHRHAPEPQRICSLGAKRACMDDQRVSSFSSVGLHLAMGGRSKNEQQMTWTAATTTSPWSAPSTLRCFLRWRQALNQGADTRRCRPRQAIAVAAAAVEDPQLRSPCSYSIGLHIC
jgi:hypothetical protein